MKSTNGQTEVQVPLVPERLSESSLPSAKAQIKVYKRRWLILILFILFAASNAMQWFQFTIIRNIISRYYDINTVLVDWTALLPMMMYIILLFPGSYLMDRIGLRRSVLLGCVVTNVGAWIKVLGVDNDEFFIVFLGQAVASSGLICLMTAPARLASYWFGSKENALATALCCFGIQFGVAFSFLITPIIIKDHQNLQDIRNDLQLFCRCMAIACSCVAAAVFFLFRDEPMVPPSESRALQKKKRDEEKGFWQPVISVLTNKNFLLLFVSYGLNAGTLSAVSTLLNPLYLTRFKNGEEDAGRIGLLFVFAGTFGSILFSMILDKTKKFKELMLTLYFFGLIAQLFFATSLYLEVKCLAYISGMTLGMFLLAYATTSYQICAELTYPEPEVISTGILNMANQIYGIILVCIVNQVMKIYSDKMAHLFFSIVLIIGFLVSLTIKNEQRRQKALNSVEYYVIRGQK